MRHVFAVLCGVVGRGAEVVLDVAGALVRRALPGCTWSANMGQQLAGGRSSWCPELEVLDQRTELFEDHLERLLEHVGQHVQPAAVRHPDHHLRAHLTPR